MRAPVYRHIESQSTIAGVSLNGFVALLGIAFGSIQALSFGLSMLVIVGSYLALRLLGRGKSPMYWQHLVLWHVRQKRTSGNLSAAARSKIPQFPFGPYQIRDHVGDQHSLHLSSQRSQLNLVPGDAHV